MARLFDIIKILFFVSSIIVAIFFLRGRLLGDMFYNSFKMLIPAYLVLTGIIIGYVGVTLVAIFSMKQTEAVSLRRNSVAVLGGVVIGIILSLIYFQTHA